MDHPFTLTARHLVADNTTEITLPPVQPPFDFTPGQYIELIFPNQPQQDDSGNHRSFSIASAPNPNGEIRLAFRNSASAFKQSLLQAPLGTDLLVQGLF